MLILTRPIGTSIVIDGTTTVTVLGLSKGQVRLGIAAPAHISVHREEIQTKVDATGDNRLQQTA